jgi:hypothetical protein
VLVLSADSKTVLPERELAINPHTDGVVWIFIMNPGNKDEQRWILDNIQYWQPMLELPSKD